jgi:Protein of unknown function (DUF3153)
VIESVGVRMMAIETRFIRKWLNLINRQLVILCCLLAVALSGCVKYETEINFTGLNYGEIVQHLQLGEQLNSFSQQAVQVWLTSIEQRTKVAQGRIEYLSNHELKIVVPFNNMQELSTKIDNYFNPNLDHSQGEVPFKSHLQVRQSNFFLVMRNQLVYDVDLRSFTIKSYDPKVSISAGNSINLDFSIQSPWGVRNVTGTGNLSSTQADHNRQVWQIQPGQFNHLEAIFWLPNPLGIGAVIIIFASISGYYLKYRQLPFVK